MSTPYENYRESYTQTLFKKAKGDVLKEFEKLCPTDRSFDRVTKDIHDIFDRLTKELDGAKG